jgi:O-acetyl-ADP-ribose deacetylase (regulator of RNase III)
MILTVLDGDIFTSPAQTLVNPVNTVGAMGAGLAQDFKRLMPSMFEAYRQACQADEFSPGQLLLYRTPHKWILNFPTRRHWRASVKLETIEQGLLKFAASFAEQGIVSASFPLLGEEALGWEQVWPLFVSILGHLPLMIYLHPQAEQTTLSGQALRRWLVTPPRVPPFVAWWRDLLRHLRREPHLLAQDVAYQAVLPKEGQKPGLRLLSPSGEALYLSESALRELWAYVVQVGYVLPHALPLHLDAHGPLIVALLARSRLLRSLRFQFMDGTLVQGAHLLPIIPPA